jgi:hypothetical protein
MSKTENVDKIMKEVNSKINSLSLSGDLDGILKKVIPKIAGDESLRKQLEKFINKK